MLWVQTPQVGIRLLCITDSAEHRLWRDKSWSVIAALSRLHGVHAPATGMPRVLEYGEGKFELRLGERSRRDASQFGIGQLESSG